MGPAATGLSAVLSRSPAEDYALAVLGAGAGGGLRLACVRTLPGVWTMAMINCAGSACLGLVAAAVPLPQRAKMLLGTGLCGGFTSFSAVSLDLFRMLEAGDLRRAAAYAAANNVGGMVCAAAGWYVGCRLFPAVGKSGFRGPQLIGRPAK